MVFCLFLSTCDGGQANAVNNTYMVAACIVRLCNVWARWCPKHAGSALRIQLGVTTSSCDVVGMFVHTPSFYLMLWKAILPT